MCNIVIVITIIVVITVIAVVFVVNSDVFIKTAVHIFSRIVKKIDFALYLENNGIKI